MNSTFDFHYNVDMKMLQSNKFIKKIKELR